MNTLRNLGHIAHLRHKFKHYGRSDHICLKILTKLFLFKTITVKHIFKKDSLESICWSLNAYNTLRTVQTWPRWTWQHFYKASRFCDVEKFVDLCDLRQGVLNVFQMKTGERRLRWESLTIFLMHVVRFRSYLTLALCSGRKKTPNMLILHNRTFS